MNFVMYGIKKAMMMMADGGNFIFIKVSIFFPICDCLGEMPRWVCALHNVQLEAGSGNDNVGGALTSGQVAELPLIPDNN